MNYTIGYSGPYGYRGVTDVKFLDINLVRDWSQMHDVYILSVAPYSNMSDELGYYKKYGVEVINPEIQSMWPVLIFEAGGESGGKIWYIE